MQLDGPSAKCQDSIDWALDFNLSWKGIYMRNFRRAALTLWAVLSLVAVLRVVAAETDSASRKEIEAFNQKFLELHLKMDTPGIMAMWADDGVDLMQGENPIVGRKTIQAWVEDILAKMPGYKVTKEELEFHDIQLCGDWATEWATEHQVAQAPEGKPNFEGFGKIALVLHREAGGEWKIKQEMWNASPKL
jgi:ketosteroid isomerase-like protein